MRTRKIKFRVWHIESKVMIYSDVVPVTIGEGYWNKSNGTEMMLMQYSGMKDINGVEIYEGDIIERLLGNGNKAMKVIFFKDGCFRASSSMGSPATNINIIHPIKIYAMKAQVKGNYLQNPTILHTDNFLK